MKKYNNEIYKYKQRIKKQSQQASSNWT